jgi:hypothetical protein
MEEIITKKYLLENPDKIFVFGDNLLRRGHGGAAALRDMENSYGFFTKKAPDNKDSSFFRPKEYKKVYEEEIKSLIIFIEKRPNKEFLISKLGGGLANKYNIFEKIIEPSIKKDLSNLKNVRFLWD